MNKTRLKQTILTRGLGALAVLAGSAIMLSAAACSGDAATAQTGATAPLSVSTSAVNENTSTGAEGAAPAGDESAASGTEAAGTAATEAFTVSYDAEDTDASWDDATATRITLSDTGITVEGSGATAQGSGVTISEAGTYVLAGDVSDGQVAVDSPGDGLVHIVLAGVDVTCADSAPLYVANSDKTVITLAPGTQNSLTDGANYTYPDAETGEPDAALFSKDDLTINGSGALTITGNCKNGIVSKDDLRITGGDITVTAVNDALKGKDLIGVTGGVFHLTAGADGLQSSNDGDAEKGYIYLEGGVFTITAGTDAIEAQTTLGISGGDFTLTTGGGSANSSRQAGQPGNDWGRWGGGPRGTTSDVTSDTTAAADPAAGDGASGDSGTTSGSTATASTGTSAKALKAGTGVFVSGGGFTIDSSDDAVHSNGNVAISGGVFAISSGDDGIHADADLHIAGGEISIALSYEGIEAAVMTVDGGTIRVVASDDALNVAGGADGSSVNGRAGQNAFTVNENNRLYLNGGHIVLDSGGDGLDCNGRVYMTGGTVVVNGPVNDGNGAVDYLGEFTVSGGFLVAVGSSGMAQAPSESSTQASIMVNFDQTQQAGTLVHIQGADGRDVLTMAPSKAFQSLVVCSPDLQQGATYTVSLGGNSTGTVTDTLYTGGTYSGGADYVSLTLADMVTISGTAGRGGMGGGGRTRPDDGAFPGGGTPPDPGMLPGGDTAPGATTNNTDGSA